MLESIAASIVFGSYISIIKFIILTAAFIAWLPLVGWIHNDSKPFGANTLTWTIAILCSGGIGILFWLLIPVYIAGMILFAVIVGATSLAYVKFRNSKVGEFDRVLTIDHIKSLLVSKEKKMESLKELTFITANKNDVPIPEPRTEDFFGYKTVYDLIKDATWRRASTVSLPCIFRRVF